MQTNNRLFDSLPAEYKARLLKRCKIVSLPIRTPIFEPETRPRFVHFLTSGIASIVAPMTEGSAVEVGIVGRDGFPESLHLLGPELGHSRCFMQVAGAGMRMDFDEFQQEFLKNSILHERVLRYVQYGTLVLGQLAACNRLHEVEERLARWLLMVQDKVEEPSLRLTQEFLAQMLGSRRSTVTVVAGTLQRAGLITYRRGNVQIVQRESLEKAACECYAISHRFLRNLYKELEPANHGSQFSD